MAREQPATDTPVATEAPEARSHLPKRIERRLLKPYGGSALGRVASGGALRALSVLVRKYPKAALHAFASGTVAAGRIGWDEIKHKLASLTGGWSGPVATAPAKTKAVSSEAELAVLRAKSRKPRKKPPQAEAVNDLPPPQADTVSDFPPELVEAARSEIIAELGERGVERARQLLHEPEQRPSTPPRGT